jgi:hypothetical protein
MSRLDDLRSKFWPPVAELGVMPETIHATLTSLLGRPPRQDEFDAVLQQSIDRKIASRETP